MSVALIANFQITVPAGATRLEVRLSTSNPEINLDLFVRYGAEVERESDVVKTSCQANGESNLLVALPGSAPRCSHPILEGVYFIAIGVNTPGEAVRGWLTATYDTGPALSVGRLLASGAPAQFTLGSLAAPRLFNGEYSYAINVPADATRLDVRLETDTPDVTVELYARFGADVAGTGTAVTRDHGPVGSNGTIEVTRASPTPLRTGTYYFALRLVTRDVPIIGTLRATVSTAALPAPRIELSPVTGLDFGGVTVGQTRNSTLAARNTGTATLTVSQIAVTSPSFSVVSPAAPFSIAAAAEQAVVVRFAPASVGPHSGSLNMTTNDPARQMVTASLTGTGQTTPPPPTGPVITQGAIVNAASFTPASLPGGSIARGSIFSMFGAGLGPPTLATPSAFPLPTALAGVSVRITQGATAVDAILLAVIATQINAIMPSNTPLGVVSITVTFGGRTSAPVTARVVESSFGTFAVNQNGMGPGIIQNFVSQTEQPINSTNRTARPRQIVILWGTGLGAITGPDNVAPPVGNLPVSVEILVGGRVVTNRLYSGRAPCCAGLDQLVFEVPADAPAGCFVPVMVRSGDVTSNAATIAIDPEGRPCSDPANPLARASLAGGKLGLITLLRVIARLQLAPADPPIPLTLDLGTADFTDERGGEFSFSPLTSLPPLGTCSTFTAAGVDLSGLLAGQLPNVPSTSRPLNAGTPLTVTGPGGSRSIPRDAEDGSYSGLLGATLPIPGQPAMPLFLAPGEYTVRGPGGPDVGAFTANLPVVAPVNWTNRDQITTVTRAQGVTLNWSGGDPARQLITIVGGNVDSQSNAAAVFLCVSPLAAGSFTVPPAILASVPPTNLQQPDQSLGFLFVGASPFAEVPRFIAPGLDAGFAVFTSLNGATITYR